MKILDFYADWCQPCKQMEPIIKELQKDHPEIEIEKINVDKDFAIANDYNVSSIPTFIFMIDKQELGREVGSVSKSKLEAYL